MTEEKKTKIVRAQAGGQNRFVRSNVDVCFFGGCLGGGKEMPNYQEILTPNGWTTHGDIKVGDTICTPFGGQTKVVGVFPQGVKQVYEFTFIDGRKCEAGIDHLWEIRTDKQREKYRKHHENKNFMVWTTRQIINELNKGKKLYLPLPNAQEFTERDYVIPPYVMGVLLGDGCLSRIKGENCFVVSNTEQDIIDKVYELSESYRLRKSDKNYSKYFYTNLIDGYKSYIKSVGLNTYSRNKFIPKEYLWGSIEQRKQLLFGLMDTDGSVEKNGSFTFSTTSRELKDGFLYLCRSLGYTATVYEDKREKYNSECAYKISIHTHDVIFSSKKHKERYEKFYKETLKDRKFARTEDHLRLLSVKPTIKTECTCIYVEDEDHLYITKDFLTTHNTFGAILSMAEPSLDPSFRGVFFRRTLGEIKTAGGIVDTFKDAYGDILHVKISDNPRMTFPNGSYIEARQIADETPKKITETYRGLQADLLAFEELTTFSWYTFMYIMTRCRGRGKWTGKVRATLNPKRTHWTRQWLDWYIGADGFPIPERDGVVRYFYLKGDKVEELVWGDSKEEVYQKCKVQIDRQMKSMGGDVVYQDMIKSFTFYKGSLAENKALLETNRGYVGNVAAVGEKMAQALIEGNFNVDLDEDVDMPIPYSMAESVFKNDPMMNNDKWITADLADTGTDNTVILVWNGLHVIDYMILCTSTPRMNADKLKFMAEKHDIPDYHIIYDGVRAVYINDYIPDAKPFISYRRACGKYGRMYRYLKDECYARFVEMVRRQMLSFDDKVSSSTYVHQKLKNPITIETEFCEECSVIQFKDIAGGKKALYNKKEMNAHLGKERSMDLVDPCAMRMMPLLEYEYGEELIQTEVNTLDEEYEEGDVDLFNDSTWC